MSGTRESRSRAGPPPGAPPGGSAMAVALSLERKHKIYFLRKCSVLSVKYSGMVSNEDENTDIHHDVIEKMTLVKYY